MKTTVLLALTLEGPDDMTEHQLQELWLEIVPVEQTSGRGKRIKIHGARIVAGGRNSDNQPYQLPADKIHTEGWTLRKPGYLGTVQNLRLATSYVAVYADPDGDDTKPYVLVDRGVDALDGTATPGELPTIRFGTARKLAEEISKRMWAECSEGSEE